MTCSSWTSRSRRAPCRRPSRGSPRAACGSWWCTPRPPADIAEPIRAGARGCLSRQAGELELLAAIRLVVAGCRYISAVLAVGPRPCLDPPCRVTKREREILELVAVGETDHGIAVRLGISENTVHSHLDRLRDKIGSRRRADLTRFALSHDIVKG